MSRRKYKVGYKKPPKKHQFTPGQSGNPNGRPRKTNSHLTLSDRLNRVLARKVSLRIGTKTEKCELFDAMLMALGEKAAKGDPRSIKLVMDTIGRSTPPPIFEIDSGDEAELERELRKLICKGEDGDAQ